MLGKATKQCARLLELQRKTGVRICPYCKLVYTSNCFD